MLGSRFLSAEYPGNSVDPEVLRAPYLLPKQSLSSVWQLETWLIWRRKCTKDVK